VGLSIEEAINATERQNSRELRERVRKLARRRFGEGEVLVKLDAILTRARRATEERNRLPHGLWAHELDGDPVYRPHGHEFQPIPPANNLDAFADDLYRIGGALPVARLKGFLHAALNGG